MSRYSRKYSSSDGLAKPRPTNSASGICAASPAASINFPALVAAFAHFKERFACGCKRFDLHLRTSGSNHQKSFYVALRETLQGEPRLYGDIADLDVSPQATGQTCGANPTPILIPDERKSLACHADPQVVLFQSRKAILHPEA